MKKILFLTVLFVASLTMNAQKASGVDSQDLPKANEIRLNALFLIVGALELDYEYLINEESGVGVSAFVALDDIIDLNYYIAPYYRFYFGKKPAAGFFFEGFASLNSTDDFVLENDRFEFQENIVDLALGLGIGGKFLTRRNIVGELSLGVGRNLFKGDDRDFEVIGKGGIKLGLRV